LIAKIALYFELSKGIFIFLLVNETPPRKKAGRYARLFRMGKSSSRFVHNCHITRKGICQATAYLSIAFWGNAVKFRKRQGLETYFRFVIFFSHCPCVYFQSKLSFLSDLKFKTLNER
jgi:hypothetical protein